MIRLLLFLALVLIILLFLCSLYYNLSSCVYLSLFIFLGLDPNSRLLMATDGLRPANPFQDEPQFEESLMMNFHPGICRGVWGSFSVVASLNMLTELFHVVCV